MQSSQARAATIQDLVASQFGPQAEAYVTSAVHAKGEDLEDLAKLIAGRGAARVLDLGCGGGHVSFTVAPHVAEVVAYDLSPDMLKAVVKEADGRGLRNIIPVQGVAEDLPFPEASFDFVVSRYSAHHWRHLPSGLAHARSVLKRGGRAIFMDVVAPANPLFDTFLQSVELLRDPSHVRDYSVAEWTRAVQAEGFQVQSVVERRLRLEFVSWVTRIATPELHVAAIRSLQEKASEEVRRHFDIEEDGTFTIDTMTLMLAPA
ncbi:class I SAM-dependent methyltransferase [Aquabacter sp. CN5-332]|uniref:class I SAM-dependent methyltransferase n=1 Tax=Aquabacter sp. CN5-332 TaxID=3156608 RepID=UPI0032B49056